MTAHGPRRSFWQIASHLWPYVRKQRRIIAASLVALVAETGLRLLEPWPLKFVFDRVLDVRHRHAVPGSAAIDALAPTTLVAVAAVALVVITGLRALAAYWDTVGFAIIGNRVLSAMRERVYRHLQCLSLSFHNRARAGELTVRVVSDVGVLQDAAVTAFLPLLGKLFVLVGMVAVMCWMNLELGLLSLAMIPVLWLSTGYLGRQLQEVSRKQRQREGAMASTTTESMGAIKAVQALSLEGTFAQTFASHNRSSVKQDVLAKRLTANLERTVDVLIAFGTALVLWRGAGLVLRQVLTPGDLLVFFTYLKTAFKPVQDFAKYLGRFAKATASSERVLDLLERVPEVRDRPDSAAAPAFAGRVQFKGVSFSYETGSRVLDQIGFDVEPGGHVALVGPSGIGKSTLVSLILRLYDPVEGSVKIDGRDIREYTLESLRVQVSVVLQDSFLFAASVRDNIGFGAPGASFEEIVLAARLANADEFIQALSEGYETILGERGVTLSNGQRQRIAIARAAIRRAPILVLDEPTTGLDKENERAVVEALERLSQGRTTFFITHDLNLAARADQIFYLENGRLAEHGTHAELIRANGRYAALHHLHVLAVTETAQERRISSVIA